MELLQCQSCIQGHLFKIPTKIEKSALSHDEREDEIMDGDSITTKAAASIFTKQFLTFLLAVQIGINNDTHLKAKVVIAFSDLQKFFIDKGLSPGQVVSILSACITNIMQEKSTVNSLDGLDSFI